jgi:two-component system response regulator AtoC
LRERRDEIPSLAEFFLRKYAPNDGVEIPLRLRQAFLEHDWPGNVRELENVVRKFLVFRSVDVITNELRRKSKNARTVTIAAPYRTETAEQRMSAAAGIAPRAPLASAAPVQQAWTDEPVEAEPVPAMPHNGRASVSAPSLAEVDQARRKAEIDTILAALNSTLWNRKQAARLLRIDYKALLYKMKKLGIGEKSPAEASLEAGSSD